MNQNEKAENNNEYESLHNTVILSEHLKPVRIIRPIIIIIMIIAVMCVYTLFQKKNTIENAEQVTNQMAEYIAGNISNNMDYARSSIKFASSTISQTMTSEVLENPAESIEPMLAHSPFDGIEYIRADGMNVMNIGEPFDASDRVYYIEGMKGKSGVWNNYHPKTSQETLMNFYTPILYQGKITGVLTGYIAATTQISPLFETKLYGEDMFGFLVDENDMIICSTIESEYIPDLSLDVFMDRFGSSEEHKTKIRAIIDSATGTAVSYKDPGGGGRICVVMIPGTLWKVVIIVPKSSINAITAGNTRNSVITIIIISLILISYAASTLYKSIKRRKEIAKKNQKLKEENRVFDEENKRAFREISAIRDIIASANMGTWRIELIDGKEPRMYVDNTMKRLLGIPDKGESPEEIYSGWFSNITEEALPSVLKSVERMKQGRFDENTYLWVHPLKGERYVRCGGSGREIAGGYLLSGYHYDVDEVVREDLDRVELLKAALNEKNDYYNTLGFLAGIYNSLHVINLAEDTIVEFGAKDTAAEFGVKNRAGSFTNHKEGAAELMARFMAELTTDEYREIALEYTDLKTLADRMHNKKYTSLQLVSSRIGWFLASFIAMETDEKGRPVRVIFTTQSIDEEKKHEERLIYKTRTDELTGLLNRRAYEEDIYEQNDVPSKDNFVFMSLDVNGLKIVNDTLGHAAGDELLVGASDCMRRSLAPYGNLYRTGGDEFIAILFCDSEKLKEVLADFEKSISSWKGSLAGSLTISYGYISKEEAPEKSVRELGVISDKRMYEAKSAYYRKAGIDRRGIRTSQRSVCELYRKILKINLSDDTYRIISMDAAEQASEKGFTDKISSWLSFFGRSGQIHPDDLEEYLKKTDLSFMREYFAGKKASLDIFYRRRKGEDYEPVMMEIIPADDYSETKQSLYLFVRQTEEA